MKRRRAVGAARPPPNDAPERCSDADDFVEAVGALLQRRGFARMAGRIFGQLLLIDPEQPSAAELAARLGASRERHDAPAPRRRADRARPPPRRAWGRYRLARRPWQALLRADLEALREVRHIAERAMRVRGARGGAAGELRDVYLLLERQLERALDRGGPEGPGEARRASGGRAGSGALTASRLARPANPAARSAAAKTAAGAGGHLKANRARQSALSGVAPTD